MHTILPPPFTFTCIFKLSNWDKGYYLFIISLLNVRFKPVSARKEKFRSPINFMKNWSVVNMKLSSYFKPYYRLCKLSQKLKISESENILES